MLSFKLKSRCQSVSKLYLQLTMAVNAYLVPALAICHQIIRIMPQHIQGCCSKCSDAVTRPSLLPSKAHTAVLAEFLQGFAVLTGAAKCRPYVLPDHYTIPLVPGDFNQIEKPRGMLFVTIISAANVPKMDWFNGSDPYVRYACLLLACLLLLPLTAAAALWLKLLQ